MTRLLDRTGELVRLIGADEARELEAAGLAEPCGGDLRMVDRQAVEPRGAWCVLTARIPGGHKGAR